MAFLFGMSPFIKGKKFELLDDEVTIGRIADNNIAFDEPSVSSKHCVIRHEDGKYTLVDLESTNGTRINGKSIVESRIYPKDIVQIGNVEVMFDGQDVESEPPQEQAAPPQDKRVEVLSGPTGVPKSFNTNSPYGTRRENRKIWWIIIGVLGFLAAGALVYFLFKLFH